jgi:F-type H+-transporting ATPase subunit d
MHFFIPCPYVCYLKVVELKEAEQASMKESERLEKEIAELREMKVGPSSSIIIKSFFQFWRSICFNILFVMQQKISTMTADEYFEKHPEVKKKFDDEIRNDYWGY